MKTQTISSTIIGKIALLSLLFFFIGMTTTFAQRRGNHHNNNMSPTDKAEKRSQKWKTEFNLTDTQTSQLKTALVKRITAMQAAKKDERGQEKGLKIKSIVAEFDAEIKGFFTTEQYAAYQTRKTDKKDKMKENRGKGKKGQGKRGQESDDDDDDF